MTEILSFRGGPASAYKRYIPGEACKAMNECTYSPIVNGLQSITLYHATQQTRHLSLLSSFVEPNIEIILHRITISDVTSG